MIYTYKVLFTSAPISHATNNLEKSFPGEILKHISLVISNILLLDTNNICKKWPFEVCENFPLYLITEKIYPHQFSSIWKK